MRKVIVLLLLLPVVTLVSSCENRYYVRIGDLWNDYDILFVEIVRPSLDIEDVDEFLAYFTTEEVLQKISEAEGILEEISTIITERNLDLEHPNIFTITQLRHLTTLQERFQDSDTETRYLAVNGIVGYRGRLRISVRVREQNIEMYHEYFGNRRWGRRHR